MGSITERPVSGDIYRHAEGKIYQICMLAQDAESGREMVVYQAMYPPFTRFVRSLADFFSPIDREMYPDAKQSQQFARVPMEKFQKEQNHEPESTVGSDAGKAGSVPDGARKASEPAEISSPLTEEELEKILCFGNIDKYIGIRITEKDLRERGIMLFFDADEIGKKRRIFTALGPYLDQVMLHNIAVTLDLVLEETEKEDQYDAILKCLGTREHFEGGRLR